MIDILEPKLHSPGVSLQEISPTTDRRWDNLLHHHPQSSVFHTREWLQALERTYGYSAVGYTTSLPHKSLTNAILFCRITGLFTRQRLVSLPFSDHCQPLVDSDEQLHWLMLQLREKCSSERWNYLELRPRACIGSAANALGSSHSFFFHKLDLRPTPDFLFRNLHKSCIQRKVKRAEKSGLGYKSGITDRLLDQFYELMVMTRRRQGLPVQPIEWFRNLIQSFGPNLTIRLALIHQQPIASILTLRHKHTLVYKYGCSDRSFSRFGGMQMLLWRAILEAKADGMLELDLGRSDADNPGLLTFKDRWGARRSELTYYRYPINESRNYTHFARGAVSRYVLPHMPNGVLTAAGRMLYKYLG